MLYDDVEEVTREIRRVLLRIDAIRTRERNRDIYVEDGHEKAAIKRAALDLVFALLEIVKG